MIAADFAFIDTSQSQSMCSKISSRYTEFLVKKYAAGKAAVHYKDITEKSFLSMEELCLE